MGKRERKARRRERLVERWRASGEPAARFARRAGVSVATLWYWKRRCREEAFPQSLLPVRLTGESGLGEGARMELVFVDGRRLLIPADISLSGLRTVLRALSTC